MSLFRILHAIKNTTAWVLMVSAIALHVFDEAVTDFLSLYHGVALDIRESLGFSFPPMVSFEVWLGGMIIGILVCFALTPIVKRGGRIIRVFTIVLGILMIVNSLGHMLGSAYSGSLLPGFWSSPLLLLTALLVIARGFRGTWAQFCRSGSESRRAG